MLDKTLNNKTRKGKHLWRTRRIYRYSWYSTTVISLVNKKNLPVKLVQYSDFSYKVSQVAGSNSQQQGEEGETPLENRFSKIKNKTNCLSLNF
jgi:hypothetical protein